jgi:hypothetical protein
MTAMSECGYSCHVNFLLDPSSLPLSRVTVCSRAQYVEIDVILDTCDLRQAGEQLESARRLLLTAGRVRGVTWEHRRLNSIENDLRALMEAFAAASHGQCGKPPAPQSTLQSQSRPPAPENISESLLESVIAAVAAASNRPALNVHTPATFKKLRNYVNNITSTTLDASQLDSVCRWLAVNKGLFDAPVRPGC